MGKREIGACSLGPLLLASEKGGSESRVREGKGG
jgi:hypothetical protein